MSDYLVTEESLSWMGLAAPRTVRFRATRQRITGHMGLRDVDCFTSRPQFKLGILKFACLVILL